MLSTTQIAQIDTLHEKRVESLQSVDELVEAVVGKLQNEGALDNTYVVFTSDNGYHHGEHRIKSGKEKPYEESIRMPLLIRGPGVQAGTAYRQANPKHRLLPDVYGPRGSNDTGVR